MLPKAIIGILMLALIGTAAGLVILYMNLQEHQSSLTHATTQLETTREALDNYKELNQNLSDANEELVSKIQDQAQRNDQLEATNSDLVAESHRIYQELRRTEEINAVLDQDIREATARNNSLTQENHDLASRNIEIEAVNDSLSQELEITDQKARTLQEQNDQQTRSIHALEEEKTSLQADVKDLEGQNQSLNQQTNQQSQTIQTLEGEKTKLAADVSELQVRNQQLTQQYDTLRSKTGSVQQLNTRIDTLRAEIRRLEDQRKPLLVESFSTSFRCTGSMEPKITCLDSATMLENFLPEDITAGTVISFKPSATCKLTGNRVLHRVMKIKVERGIHYYWPKGDNNSRPDECWIQESNVFGYVIKLHKNTRPQNAELRDLVNSADADAERAWEAYQSKRVSYGCPDPHRVCTVSSRSRFNELNRLRSRYIAASIYHQCWVDSASGAWYSGFGPPVYSLCIK